MWNKRTQQQGLRVGIAFPVGRVYLCLDSYNNQELSALLSAREGLSKDCGLHQSILYCCLWCVSPSWAPGHESSAYSSLHPGSDGENDVGKCRLNEEFLGCLTALILHTLQKQPDMAVLRSPGSLSAHSLIHSIYIQLPRTTSLC